MAHPEQLGKYRISQEIGRGGFSVVYRAADTTLRGRPVALKVLHPHLVMVDPAAVARFRQEAGVAANLRHPNIVTIYDFGEAEGLLFIAMELVDGTDLGEIIKAEGPLPLARAVPILQQIASALDYAHAQGVIHRDVKSGNVLVEPAGRAVLTDFGLVKAAEGTGLTTSGQTLGTPEYMSPEQAELEEGQEVDGRADLYALGVVAYEMLTGRVPFQARTPTAVLHKQVYEPPPPPTQANPALPPALEPVLLKALAKRREDRYQSGAEMVAALQAAQAPQVKAAPAVAPPPVVRDVKPVSPPRPPEPWPTPSPQPHQPVLYPSSEPVRRWPLWAMAGGVALALVALVICLTMLVGVASMGRQHTPTQGTTATHPAVTPSFTASPSTTAIVWPTVTTVVSPRPSGALVPYPGAATVTVSVTPGTPAPFPTVTAMPTVTPAATSTSINAAVSPTITPMPTVTRAPSGQRYPAPVVLGPPDDAVFTGRDAVILMRWQSAGTLAADEYCVVTFEYPHEGSTWRDQQWTKDTTLQVPRYLYDLVTGNRMLHWNVTVMRLTGTKADGTREGVPLSAPSEIRWFVWQILSGPGPQPPTPTFEKGDATPPSTPSR